jgi:hypothetical protein
MEDASSGLAVILFLVCLPASLTAWVLLLMGWGRLEPNGAGPAWYRFVAVRLGSIGGPKPNTRTISYALIFLAFVNFVPIAVLVHNPYDTLALLVDIAYIVVQLALVTPLFRISHRRGRG